MQVRCEYLLRQEILCETFLEIRGHVQIRVLWVRNDTSQDAKIWIKSHFGRHLARFHPFRMGARIKQNPRQTISSRGREVTIERLAPSREGAPGKTQDRIDQVTKVAPILRRRLAWLLKNLACLLALLS
jgi:hypothetical protein